jgi:hypothetical protein
MVVRLQRASTIAETLSSHASLDCRVTQKDLNKVLAFLANNIMAPDWQVPQHLSPVAQEQGNQRLSELIMEPSVATFL